MSKYDELEEEIERRLIEYLEFEGIDPDSDSDHAMFLREDIRNEVRAEYRKQNTESSNGNHN